MKVVTADEMRQIDRTTIEQIGIPSAVLMERAGVSVVKHIIRLFPNVRVIVLAGGGNNGGDGLVIARELFNHSFDVRVILLSDIDKLSPDNKLQYEIAKKLGINIIFKSSVTVGDLKDSIIIDAILGTGLSNPVRDKLAKVIDMVNRIDGRVVAVDIPSGISSDTGEVMGKAIRTDLTVTFGLPKRGHLIFPGREYTGELFIENIGFPQSLLASEMLYVESVEKEQMGLLIPDRPDNSHKGDYGHLLVVGGARGKTGAAIMTAKAALKAGSGLVTIGVPETMIDIFQNKVIEEMTTPLPDNGKGGFSKASFEDIIEFIKDNADVVAIGPGMGYDNDTLEVLSLLIKASPVPLIIDADGLNSLSLLAYNELIKLLINANSPVIITPHPGEMARLRHSPMKKDRIETTRRFAQDAGVYTILKGSPTIIAEPEGMTFINSTGNSGMATAGSGDVLTGIIASFIGQGLSPINASMLGVYLHGLSGDISAVKSGKHATTALNLIENLPDAMKSINSH